MRRKNLLFLSFLLSQTAPVWSMWNVEDERAMAIAGNGHPRLNVRHIDFEPFWPPQINTLDPSDPLPQNWGTAKQRVQCTFANNATVNVTLPTEYPLHGQWLFQEDRDNTQNLATLKLRLLWNNQHWRDVYERHEQIQHTLVDPGVEIEGGYYFDGNTAYQARTKRQQWLNPRNQQRYARTISIRDGEIPAHQGYDIIYTEPFAFGGQPSQARDAYRGEYHFIRDLSENEELPGKKIENLIYSDGNHIYLPHITQELWGQGHFQVGFLVASYKQDRKLSFISQAQIPYGQPPKGFYQIVSVEEQPNRRIERWQKLEDDPQHNNILEIMCPAGVASIPGLASLAPREVPTTNAAIQIKHLQDKLDEGNLKMASIERYIANYPHADGSVVILGPTGSGKTILAHLLADQPINVVRVPLRGLRLEPNHLLPEFALGHGGQAGTSFPAVWYDQAQNLFIADCPGFGDPGGAEPDILNAFLIYHLLMNRGQVKIVVAAKEGDMTGRSTHFIKLLNDITSVFPNDQELQNNVSFVATSLNDIQPDEICDLLRDIASNTPQLDQRSRELLTFLADRPSRVSGVPKAQQVGRFNFDTQFVQGGIAASRYVPNPQTTMAVGAEANLLALTLGQHLNDYLTHYMKTQGCQHIINYCRHKIDSYSGHINNLREEFKQLKTTLKNLRNVASDGPSEFINILSPFMNTEEITKIINFLSFLKKIKDDVNYNVGEWARGFLTTVEAKIKNLAATPQVTYNNGILNLKGILVGTSDIEEAFRAHPNSTTINAYSLNSLFVDEDITAQGVSVNLPAPHWKVIGARNINLSGTDGAHGANGCHGYSPYLFGRDGEPGHPGGNGGHFYGKGFLFERLNQLTTNTNGGSGGNGGKGGNGAAGISGEDGDLDKVTQKGYEIENGIFSKFLGPKYFEYYHDMGEVATNGGYAGPGGSAGIGGHYGTSSIAGHQWASNSQNGQHGNNGNSGTPGEGGRFGRHCRGTYTYFINQNGVKVFGSWREERRHSDYVYANRGKVPSELNTSGQQQPIAQTDFDAIPIVQAYKDYYEQQAVDVNICPFIKVFPNL